MLNTIKTVHNVCKAYTGRVVESLSMDVKVAGYDDWTFIQSKYLKIRCQFCEKRVSDGGVSWPIQDEMNNCLTSAGGREADRLERSEAVSWVNDAARNTISDDSRDATTRTTYSRRVNVRVAGRNAAA